MSNDFTHLLKDKGLKVTHARLLIIDVFSDDCKPINAEHIFIKLKPKNINRVTIYRTLASFDKTEIIKKVDLRMDSTYYELAGNHHHHIVCTNCGKTEGFESCSIDQVSKMVLRKSPLFSTISQHSLELFGICKPCSIK